MTDRLTPCPACARHVRVSEVACPFCSEALALTGAELVPSPRARLGSLALMTFRVAALGVALTTACGGSADDDDDENGQAGAAPQAGAGGSTGGRPANPAGSGGNGGSIDLGGGPSFGGAPNGGDGNGVPIYRATPRG